MKTLTLAVSALALTALAGSALAGDTTITVSTPTNTVPMPVVVSINGVPVVAPMIPPGVTAIVKRDIIMAALGGAGYPCTPAGGPANPSLQVHQVPAHSTVRLDTGNTGEINDKVTCPAPTGAGVGFLGHFAPMSWTNQPAVFRAGIVTDVGELSVQVSAQELNFQTDGPIICQALFQRLAPRAPQYGAQINYAGDRLEVYFDPAYTVTQGGIIFGTTSQNSMQGGGCGGGVTSGQQAPPCRADFNGDGFIDFFDMDEFMSAFLTGDPRADFNGDGFIDFFDMDEYVQAYEHGCD